MLVLTGAPARQQTGSFLLIKVIHFIPVSALSSETLNWFWYWSLDLHRGQRSDVELVSRVMWCLDCDDIRLIMFYWDESGGTPLQGWPGDGAVYQWAADCRTVGLPGLSCVGLGSCHQSAPASRLSAGPEHCLSWYQDGVRTTFPPPSARTLCGVT